MQGNDLSANATAGTIIDLHVHSSASDGTLSPADVVRLAASRNVRCIGLTDHDTTQGIDEAVDAGKAAGVEVIPGIELSTSVDSGELHMLGYFIDHHDQALLSRLAEFRTARQGRAARIVERLNAAGVPVDLERVRQLAGDGSIGRAHVARALVEIGTVRSMDEAFDMYLSRGRPGYVPRLRLSPVDAVRLVHSAHGVAVLAHPFTVDGLGRVLPELVSAGLNGIEVFYSLYNQEQRSQLAAIAARLGLVPAGGSDFHGPGEREGRDLGSADLPPETVTLLRQARQHVH